MWESPPPPPRARGSAVSLGPRGEGDQNARLFVLITGLNDTSKCNAGPEEMTSLIRITADGCGRPQSLPLKLPGGAPGLNGGAWQTPEERRPRV